MKDKLTELNVKIKELQKDIDDTSNRLEQLAKVDSIYLGLLKHLGYSYISIAEYLTKAANLHDKDNKDLYLK